MLPPSENPLLSIIFPAYNEARSIRPALEHALAFVQARNISGEILVVDDGSRDETHSTASEMAGGEPQVRVLSHSPNRGKGYAVKRGMLSARGAYRVFLDVDLATPLEEIDPLLASLQAGADIVLGSRYLPGSRLEVKQGRLRRWMGAVFRWFARRILRLPTSDVTCGFKGFRAAAAERLFAAQRESGWAFDAELIHLAFKWGMNVREIPVRWRDAGDSAVQPLSAARESLAALLRIRRNDRRGVYDRSPATRE